ncbi:ATP-binding protein [Haliangium sp.]|uniref:ATP-binding protein n=1 Tax=Haliangium sp. TaxID=2663208 RepID=UPI003D0D5F94
MSHSAIFPAWADELRHRYLRGEAWLFVVHGNVHDLVLHQGKLVGAVDFLAGEVLDKKNSILRYNVSTGCRFVKKTPTMDALAIEDLIAQRNPERVLPVLEQLLYYQRNVGLVIDHAEMIAPAGDPSFFSQGDRMSVVTLQRWSLAPEIERADNIVLLVTESPGELNPKIVANPRVAAVAIPMPDIEQRRAVIRQVNADLDDTWVERFADITAGLRSIQIKSILQPPPEGEDDPAARLRFIEQLVGDGKRARKLATLTQGMSRDEIQELVGVEAPAAKPGDDSDGEFDEVLGLIARRKREIIERECFGIIEFVEPDHDFAVVGGMDEIKRELGAIARDIRDGRKSRVPMGLLFTGPMGTGKTFVAEAFVKESGLTGVKLKNFRSKWVGATESNLERILDVIRAIGNVIVIIDEGDRSFGSDDGGDSGTSSRVIARLKEFMSDTSNRGRVLFILMTNRPDKLDIDIKRAGRLDRKIPFLYPQTPDQVERVLEAQIRKHDLTTEIAFPRDRERVSAKLVGYSNADLEALSLLAYGYAGADDVEGQASPGIIDVATFERAVADYLPSRDRDMLEYMELLAVFEASNRRMLPPKYAELSVEELQARLDQLRVRCAGRR